MAYSSGFRNKLVTILNRKEQKVGKYGIDSAGVEWEAVGTVWANVSWAKGNRSLNNGSLDVYGVESVPMLWNDKVTMRSRIQYDGKTYQILPEMFHADYQRNEIEFKMQIIINDK